jgi:hypothetical protein
MPHALTAALVVLSVFSILFVVRRYQAATPEQRPQIILAACGAVVVAAVMWFLVGRP